MINVVIASDRTRSARLSFDTDSVAEAVADAVAQWFERTDVDKEGGFAFAVVVEDASVKGRLSRETVSERINQIGSAEGDRAIKAREQPQPRVQKEPREP